MTTQLAPDLTAALAAPEPLMALRSALSARLAAGADRAVLESELLTDILALRAEGREAEEELLADVSDFLVGWCAPHMAL